MNVEQLTGTDYEELAVRTGVKPRVLRQICAIAEESGIQELVLFGSRARGDFGRASDIDLACRGGHTAMFAVRVDGETSTPLKYDVIGLDDPLDDVLRANIRKDGIALL